MASSVWTMDVVFPFDADVVPRGGRSVRRTAFWGRASVGLRVLDRDVFRPALVLRNHVPRSGWRMPTPQIALMGFEGALWAPLPDGQGRQEWIPGLAGRANSKDPRVRGDNPFDLRGDTVRVAADGFRRRPSSAPVPEHAADEVALRRVESSGYEQAAADAARMADSLLVVDRKVWRRCHDPFWQHDYNAWLIFGRDDPERSSYRPELDQTTTFRVDRIDDMRRWTRELARRKRGVHAARDQVGEAEILDPSCLSRDDMRHYADRLDVFADLARPLLKEASAEVLFHCAALREKGTRLAVSWSRPLAFEALRDLDRVRRQLEIDHDRSPGYAMRVHLRNWAWTTVQRAVWFDGFDMKLPAMAPPDEEAMSAIAELAP